MLLGRRVDNGEEATGAVRLNRCKLHCKLHDLIVIMAGQDKPRGNDTKTNASAVVLAEECSVPSEWNSGSESRATMTC